MHSEMCSQGEGVPAQKKWGGQEINLWPEGIPGIPNDFYVVFA